MAALHLSSYAARVDLVNGTHVLLLSGATGALDLAPRLLAERIWRPWEAELTNTSTDALPPATRTLLTERGYLTNKPEQEETILIDRILSTFASKVRARLEFRVVVDGDAVSSGRLPFERQLDDLADLVSTIYEGGASGQAAILIVELNGAVPDSLAERKLLLDTIFQAATALDIDIDLITPAEFADAVMTKIPNPRLRELTISDHSRASSTTNDSVIALITEALQFRYRVTWISERPVWTARDTAELVAQRQAVAGRLGIVEKSQIQHLLQVPQVSDVAGLPNETVARDQVPLLRSVFKLTGLGAAGREPIGLTPVTVPSVVEIVCAIPDHRSVLIRSKANNDIAGKAIPRGDLSDIKQSVATFIERGRALRYRLWKECGTRCPYALVCDAHCETSPNDQGGSTGIRCRGDFEQRLARVAPALVANVHSARSVLS